MAGLTDIGKRRKNNQDSIYFDEPQGIGIVADGIGGRKGGALASAMIVEGLKRAFLDTDRIRHEEINTFVISAIDRINAEVINRGKSEDDTNGMGTTLNFLMFVGDKLHLAHIGDSRTYLFHRNHLFQLTIDHNLQTFVERGWLPRAAMAPGVKAEALVRSIGLSMKCEPDVYQLDLKPGEIFLTCSDGLTAMVSDKRIAQIMAQNQRNFARLPQILVEEANSAGGKDNITVLCTQIVEG